MYILVFVLVLLNQGYTLLASSGDISPAFLTCINKWKKKQCPSYHEAWPLDLEMNVLESLIQWSCDSEVKYRCMWFTVEDMQKQNQPVVKFYGKLGTNAFLWSTLYHTKETLFNEHMDYFGALAAIAGLGHVLVVRISKGHHILTSVVRVCLLCLFLHHVYYMMFIKFDYGYSRLVSFSIGIPTALGWATLFILNFWKFRRHRKRLVWMILLLFLLVSPMFTQDFPPVAGLIDQHSLWHLFAIPVAYWFHRFMLADCKNVIKLP